MAKKKKNGLPDTSDDEFDQTGDDAFHDSAAYDSSGLAPQVAASSELAVTPQMFSLNDEFCPRQISFTIPGKVGVHVTATETGDGSIDFVVDVLGSGLDSADLRGLFFHYDESKLGNLLITGGDGWITETQINANSVIDLGQGANMHGKADPFDVGIEFGTPGKGHDFLDGPIHFTLTNAAQTLTLDDFAHLQFGARTTSTGDKMTTLAPAAPDAKDDFETTHEDTQIVIQVLGNDTDADGDTLFITSVHLESGVHGTVEIAPDGKSIIYTPDKDYAGLNVDPDSIDATFEYCVSDGNGGQDSANVNVHIIPVADQPTITFEVLPPEVNDPINLVRLKVTAAQSDLDGSEFINHIEFGALPPGVTLITDGSLDTVGQPDSVVEFVQLVLPTGQDVNFDLNVTAVSEEEGNGDPDTASVTASKHIEVDFNQIQTQKEFLAVDQNIWSSGDDFFIDEHPFLGPNIPFDESFIFPTPTFPPVPAEAFAKGHFKAGLQIDIHIEGGDIDAHLPYNIFIETTYNKTTDSLLVHTGAELAAGGGFDTTGPEGSVGLSFILDFLAEVGIEDALGLGFGVSHTFKVQPDPLVLFSASSTDPDLPFTYPLPAGFSLTFDWPHLSTVSSSQTGNEISGEGASNNFAQLNLDVDFAAAQLFPLFAPIEAVLDPDPTSEDNFELLDLDVHAGANFIQEFILKSLGLEGSIILENGESKKFGEDFIIRNASQLDGNDLNTTLDFALSLTPNATLDNNTSIGFNAGGQLGLLTNIPIIDDSLFDEGISIPIASIPIDAVDPFKLNFNSQGYEFVV